ncbi:hypothetical protein ABW19_dt0201708 [Dactylella cylindrospora]|nr:hypothetical protein ABW19_dt0201708 [Dactylella cylindrospora]
MTSPSCSSPSTSSQPPPSPSPPPPNITSLVLIPPILDCIVTYLHTIDLLHWSSTNQTARQCLLSSHAAWRAISFYTPTKPFNFRENSTSIYSSTIAVRSHNSSPRSISPVTSSPPRHSNVYTNGNGGNGYNPGSSWNALNPGKASRCLSIDTTLTVLARLLPLGMYTSIDLSRTKADKHLLWDLLGNCHALRYLVLEDCPELRVADLVVGLHGLEKKVLKAYREEVRRKGGEGSGGGSGGGELVSLVAEVMGRMVPPKGEGAANGTGAGNVAGAGSMMGVHALSRLKHIHTKEVRDGLYRLHELRDGVRGDIVRLMSKMEDAYTYPEMPEPIELERKVVQLREIRTDLNLHRSTYNGPGWLERLAYSQGDYLFMLCHLMGVKLVYAD